MKTLKEDEFDENDWDDAFHVILAATKWMLDNRIVTTESSITNHESASIQPKKKTRK